MFRKSTTLLAILVSVPVLANPTTENPEVGLSTHQTVAAAKSLASGAYATCQRLRQDVEPMREIADKSKLNPRKIQSGGGDAWAATQDAIRLQWMGETAGYDLEKQLTAHSRTCLNLGAQFIRTQPGTRAHRNVLAVLRKTATKRGKLYQKARQLTAKGQYEAAVRSLRSHGEELMGNLNFLSLTEQKPYRQAFGDVYSPAWTGYREQQKEMVRQAAADRANSYRAALQKHFSDVANLRSSFAGGGPWSINNKTASDPMDALRLVRDRTLAMWAAAVRIEAMDKMTGGDESSSLNSDREKLLDAMAQTVDSMVRSTNGTDAASVYPALLPMIASVDHRLGNDSTSLYSLCETSLDGLLQSDPELQRSAQQYEIATKPVLDMRAAYANARTNWLMKNGSIPAGPYLESRQPEPSQLAAAPAGADLSRMARSEVAPANITRPILAEMREASPRMVERSLTVGPLLRLSPSGPTSVSPISNRYYASTSVPIDTTAASDDLSKSLFVENDFPALTYEAAAAVADLEAGDFRQCGGVCVSVHCESLMTRVATLTPIGAPLVDATTAADIDLIKQPASKLLWRLDLTPRWVATDHAVHMIDANAR